MAAFMQRECAQTPADGDTDSDESDAELPPPTNGPLAAALKHTDVPATAGTVPVFGTAASGGSPSRAGGLLRRLGALRRSVSPGKKGTAGTIGPKQSPQKASPTCGRNGDVSASGNSAAAHAQRQHATSRPHGGRQRVLGGAAVEGRDLPAAQPSHGVARSAGLPQYTQHHGDSAGPPMGTQAAPPSGRSPLVRENSAAARLPDNGARHATAAAVSGIVRSGSDASSLATEMTVASGVSSGLGNARTAADSYGGSVFASALNHEAGLQLLNQVLR